MRIESENQATGEVDYWLRDYPWEDIVATLARHWKVTPEHLDGRSARQARELWLRKSVIRISLGEALRVCRRCQASHPFGAHDCETFAAIARDIVKPLLRPMSRALAHAAATVVADYVRGTVNAPEMRHTLDLIMEKSGLLQTGAPAG
jgi:hypothetical protein